jgi:hypothetical protein
VYSVLAWRDWLIVFWLDFFGTSNEDDITVRLLGILNCNNSLRTCVEQGLAAEKTMVGFNFFWFGEVYMVMLQTVHSSFCKHSKL